MMNLMHEMTSSDIRLSELKLKRIKLCKKRLLETKPSRLRQKKFIAWQSQLEELIREEEAVEEELRKAYIDLEDFYN